MGRFDEYVSAADEAFSRDPGEGALTGVGFTDIVGPGLDDPQIGDAVFATFVGQGRRLGRSSALFRLLAAPFLRALDQAPPDIVACPVVQHSADGVVVVAPAAVPGEHVLVDLGDEGVRLVGADRAVATEAVPFDPALVAVRSIALADLAAAPRIALADAEGTRAEALATGRLAAAHEILGAGQVVLELGRGYAAGRTQFGQPIAEFQAVRHLLASASLDVESAGHLCRAARRTPLAAPASVAKAVAGRNGRRIADRVGQVFGGIGFTWEHSLHLYQRRILLLDSLIGSSAELFADLGRAEGGGRDPADILPLTDQLSDFTTTGGVTP